MKLGETVNYPGLEGVSLYGSILCSLSVPSSFGAELVLKRAWAASFPGVFWEPPLWWEVRMELEGLEPEPGASWGFPMLNGCNCSPGARAGA